MRRTTHKLMVTRLVMLMYHTTCEPLAVILLVVTTSSPRLCMKLRRSVNLSNILKVECVYIDSKKHNKERFNHFIHQ